MAALLDKQPICMTKRTAAYQSQTAQASTSGFGFRLANWATFVLNGARASGRDGSAPIYSCAGLTRKPHLLPFQKCWHHNGTRSPLTDRQLSPNYESFSEFTAAPSA